MELLLAYVKTHSSRCFSPPFLRQLFLVMVSTEVWLHPTHHPQSQLVRLYAQRIFRCIYDKSDDAEDSVSSPRHQIIFTLVDMLELFQERWCLSSLLTRSLRQIEAQQVRQEAEVVVDSSGEGGPLFFLLTLIRSLFLSQGPQCSQGFKSVGSQGVTSQGVTPQGVTSQGVTSQGVTSRELKEPPSQDFFLLVSHLLSTFGAISDEHPDFLFASFLLLI